MQTHTHTEELQTGSHTEELQTSHTTEVQTHSHTADTHTDESQNIETKLKTGSYTTEELQTDSHTTKTQAPPTTTGNGYIRKEHIYDVPNDIKPHPSPDVKPRPKVPSAVDLDVTTGRVSYIRSHDLSNTVEEEREEKGEEPIYDSITRQPILPSATKERPRPPPGRRHPSISPSHSMRKLSEEEEEEEPFYVNLSPASKVNEASDSEDESNEEFEKVRNNFIIL